jgi:hypothetical protein
VHRETGPRSHDTTGAATPFSPNLDRSLTKKYNSWDSHRAVARQWNPAASKIAMKEAGS